MSDVFPGCRANLNKLIPYLIPEPFTAPDKPGTAILIAILRTVRRWDLPTVQTADCMAFVHHHYPGLWPRIQSVLDKVRGQCASTEAAIAYAREIMEILQRYCQIPPKAPQKQNPPSTDSSQQGNSGKGSDDKQQSAPEKDASASAHERSESPSETTAQNAQGAQDDDASDSHPKAGGTGGTEPSAKPEDKQQSGHTQDNSFTTGVSYQMSFSEGDKTDCASPWNQTDVEALLNYRDAELPKNTGEFLKDSLQKTCRAHSYDKISVAKVKTKWTRPLSLLEMGETKRATTALRTRLQSLLQASVLKRSKQSQRGRLNSGKLYRGMIHDPKLFLHREEKQSRNTAVHILLDSSGSMGSRIGLAGRTCYAVGKALETVPGLTVGISVFPADREGGIYPLVPQGSPVHNRFYMDATGNTPLGEALWWTIQTMIGLPQTRKVVLIVTDGQPSDPDLVLKAIAYAKLFGFELYGIGIVSEQICYYLPKSSMTIHKLDDLPKSMFTVLQKALLQK